MNISKLLIPMLLLLWCGVLPAKTGTPTADAPTILLWPVGHKPGEGAKEPEKVKPSTDGFTRVTNVSEPSLTIFQGQGDSKMKPAVLICPGGGYDYLVIDKEGAEIAAWFNTLGITGIVLKYRVPSNREGAFQDIQRAMRLMRFHAKEWNLDAEQIGVMGFSAGGHLCARLSTNYATPAYTNVDDVDQLSCRPRFVVLVYPAYLNKEGQVAPELPVCPRVPETLMVHSEDDKRFVPGSKLYDAALTHNGVEHEYLLFQTGGHGYGLHCQKEAKVWTERCYEWLKSIQIL